SHDHSRFSLRSVIRRLFRNRHVVDVAFPEPGRRDANDAGIALQRRDGGAAAIAHAGAQPPYELMNHRGDAAFVGNAPFDAFRHQLLATAGAARRVELEIVLKIAVAAAAPHRADRSHAAILLEAAALVENQLPGTLV